MEASHRAMIAPRIVLGTATFGSAIDRKTSFAVLDAYAEKGGDFIDTAHIYAAWIADGWGASERTVGEWLKAHGARDTFLIATKGGHPPMDDMTRGRCDRASLEQDLNDSLTRLGIEYVDLYWLHRDEPSRSVEEIIDTLAGFIRDGRIRAYGLSNWLPVRIDTALAYALKAALPAAVGSQIGWALADHPTRYDEASPMLYMDDTLFRWHVASQLPLVAYSAQATGYFGDANVVWAQNGFAGPAPCGRGFDSPASRKRLLAAITLECRKGCTPAQIALAYLLHQPFRVFPIISSRHPERICDALAATAVPLAPDEIAMLRLGCP